MGFSHKHIYRNMAQTLKNFCVDTKICFEKLQPVMRSHVQGKGTDHLWSLNSQKHLHAGEDCSTRVYHQKGGVQTKKER